MNSIHSFPSRCFSRCLVGISLDLSVRLSGLIMSLCDCLIGARLVASSSFICLGSCICLDICIYLGSSIYLGSFIYSRIYIYLTSLGRTVLPKQLEKRLSLSRILEIRGAKAALLVKILGAVREIRLIECVEHVRSAFSKKSNALRSRRESQV